VRDDTDNNGLTEWKEDTMPYIFALLVAANAVFMGYHLLKTKDPQVAAHIQVEQKEQFPETLELVKDAR
jgi:hypothetical protein